MPIEQLTKIGNARAITRWGDPVLHAPARPVDDFGNELQHLLADMFATNTAAAGAGLAAPQIGVPVAAFLYDCLDGDLRRRTGVIWNPALELPYGRARRLEVRDEGCLSLPGGHADVARLDQAVCRGQDQFGEEVEVVGSGQLARCLQHEADHLQGIVFGDRLSSRRRRDLYRSHARVASHYPADWPINATR